MQWEVLPFISEVVGTGALSITLFYIAKQIVIQSGSIEKIKRPSERSIQRSQNRPLYI